MESPATDSLPPITDLAIFPVIYYTSYTTPFSAARFSQLLAEIPERFREKTGRFRRWQDAHADLLGKHLLLHAFKAHNCKATLNDIAYTKYGRPFVADTPDFNISHSGEMVVCSISPIGRIGIDIEQNAPIAVADFRNQFSPEEWRNIEQANPQEPIFYKYWTIKEAILKADGRGIFQSLDTLHVADSNTIPLDDQQWHITAIGHFEKYICHIATDIPHQQYILRKVSFA